MLKKYLKKAIQFTPYEIKRRTNNPIKNNKTSAILHNSPGHMDKLFSDESFLEKYDSINRRDLYNFMIAHFPERWTTLADFGCGPGLFLAHVKRHFPNKELYGFEYSPVCVALACNASPGVDVQLADINSVVAGPFDVIVCSQTLEHIPYPDRVLRNIIHSLSKGGSIILTVPDGRADTYHGHINFWSEESFGFWLETTLGYNTTHVFRIDTRSGFDYIFAMIRPDET